MTSRGLSTSSASYQQPLESSENEEPLRLAACQMPTMLDIGARNIFTSDHDMFREHTRRWMREKLAPLQNSFEENGQPSREIWTEMGEQVIKQFYNLNSDNLKLQGFAWSLHPC